jgi:hypothetical protein
MAPETECRNWIGGFSYMIQPKPTRPPEEPSVSKQLQQIMDSAFEQVREVINSIQVVDMLSDEHLDQLARYRELLKMKQKIDELLKED